MDAKAKFIYPNEPQGVELSIPINEAHTLLGLLNNIDCGTDFIYNTRNALRNLFPENVVRDARSYFNYSETDRINVFPYKAR